MVYGSAMRGRIALVAVLLGACSPARTSDWRDARGDGAPGIGGAACDAASCEPVCQPGTGSCQGAVSHACLPDGSGWEDVECDPIQGMRCGDSGLCEGACAPATLGRSYIGCDYYPTVTGNMVGGEYRFAVAVANTTDRPASLLIDGGALAAPRALELAAHSVAVEYLPWRTDLKLCAGQRYVDCLMPATTSLIASGGAYHLRSDVPVTVYQFNPLDYDLPEASSRSFSNDASLLYPTTAWGRRYLVATWERRSSSPGLFAVTARRSDTLITVTPRVATEGPSGLPPFAAGMPQTILLHQSDVVELGTALAEATGDLTGSLVEADAPVQVIGAHYCADVPVGVHYCDHLEESMIPIASLGTRYLVSAPAVPTLPAGKEEVVRIIATEPDTQLTYDPPQPGAPTSIAAAGGIAEIARTPASFLVSASHKVMVVQYMEGSAAGGGTGDPAMALAVPIDQFRSEYLFHAPVNYETSYVDITAAAGTEVVLDGDAVTGWSDIGSTGYRLARVTRLGRGPGRDGNHVVTGTGPFGITVYGYGQDTSYWYPGGLDLVELPVE